MENSNTKESKLCISIISDSEEQLAKLKELVENNGTVVLESAKLNNFQLDTQQKQPSVLLIGLDNADDAAFDNLDELMEKTDIPMLFNESVSFPKNDQAAQEDWTNNILNKLHELAGSQPNNTTPVEVTVSHTAEKAKIDIPKIMNIPTQKTIDEKTKITSTHTKPNTFKPIDNLNVIVIANSKTRRRTLKAILDQQGIKQVEERDYHAIQPDRIDTNIDILLIDNYGVEEKEEPILVELEKQDKVPTLICNSAEIPFNTVDRDQWGKVLSNRLIGLRIHFVRSLQNKLATLDVSSTDNDTKKDNENEAANTTSTSQTDNLTEPKAEDWGQRISFLLANARTKLQTTDLQEPLNNKDTNIQKIQNKSTPTIEKPDSIDSVENIESTEKSEVGSSTKKANSIKINTENAYTPNSQSKMGIRSPKPQVDTSSLKLLKEGKSPSPKTSKMAIQQRVSSHKANKTILEPVNIRPTKETVHPIATIQSKNIDKESVKAKVQRISTLPVQKELATPRNRNQSFRQLRKRNSLVMLNDESEHSTILDNCDELAQSIIVGKNNTKKPIIKRSLISNLSKKKQILYNSLKAGRLKKKPYAKTRTSTNRSHPLYDTQNDALTLAIEEHFNDLPFDDGSVKTQSTHQENKTSGIKNIFSRLKNGNQKNRNSKSSNPFK